MTGYGSHYQPPGTWSDDSSLTLATLESIVRKSGIYPFEIMLNFALWYKAGKFTANGEVFDIGGATQMALCKFLDGIPYRECGSKHEGSNGNGALMRILPLAFVPHSIHDLRAVAGLTHAHEISQTACEIYTDLAIRLLAGMNKRRAFYCAISSEFRSTFERLGYLETLSRDEIKSSGYVVDTLEAALWCLLKTDCYRDCVLTAVNLGGDTDTVAAVAGGLAGILYGVGGEKGIPEEWIEQIAKHEEIKALCEDFARSIQRGR